ncbi:uncharacterized protein LAESUDRAFT_308808 [Laetiporus sulphureus 93-53]|uniref:Uncharacterized protein n=1 Tax=Laetiporus sulphureus 93-53 TaxID=1314785 RepID=A0A165D9X6_9APHY|nr:uncharacterized protein LAESUDRAFT_308808 [Laetiporus sulphureus 93-53]KZT04407.1 hypothetical protein LAESUDRAFT_308808 [Laetiporus sulphureus 93-53]
MDRSGNPMMYMDGSHNVRLMMPRPIPPPESSYALRKGLWDCHVVDGKVVIMQQTLEEAGSLRPGYVDAGSLSKVSRLRASDSKRVRQVPVGPRPMKRQPTLGMRSKTSATQREYSMAAVAHLKEASQSIYRCHDALNVKRYAAVIHEMAIRLRWRQ